MSQASSQQNATAEPPLALHVRPFREKIGISNSTFWKYVGLGKIRIVRVGGRVLVPMAEVDRILREGA